MQTTALQNAEVVLNNDRKLLEALARSDVYRQYERTFTEATGLPLALRPVEFFSLPFHGKKNENGFCAFLAGGKGSCALCLQTQARCASDPGAEPRSIQCSFGLTETTVPVRLGDRVIGFLATGQVFTRRPNVAAFKQSIRRLFPLGSTAQKKAAQLWKKSPVMPASRYQATVQLLTFFASQLSALSNQIVTEQANAEPHIVTRARQFIAQNKHQSLSLADVAHAAGASIFHFCKVFRQSTGLKFTDYVARVRLEDARTGLLNPNLRISEVAYDVGFQSLTQFNRTFRRIFGQSPTDYRAKLPATRVGFSNLSTA
jgi:AraC-like DNA-binding protein/ligand-binding sensor protein